MTDPEPISLDGLLREGAAMLPGEDAWRESALLLANVMGRDRVWLLAHGNESASPQVQAAYRQHLQRRLEGEPIAYLLGRREFWSLPLRISADVLIPRPETELLVERALQIVAAEKPMRVADLGTGSGAIALAIASERPLVRVLATDASPSALTVASSNAQRLGLASRVEFRLGHWCQALIGKPPFHLIVSNPPYIPEQDPHLAQGDLRFEPLPALASGHDGLAAITEIIGAAGRHLRAGGWLILEHGHDQADAVCHLLELAGFVEIDRECDLAGQPRISFGRWPD